MAGGRGGVGRRTEERLEVGKRCESGWSTVFCEKEPWRVVSRRMLDVSDAHRYGSGSRS